MDKTYKINLIYVVWGRIGKKILLIKMPSPLTFLSIYELNGIGLEIWNMLIKNYGLQRILKTLIKKYPSSKKQIRSDFSKFINRLKNNKIVDEIH